MSYKPLALVIMDGFGISDKTRGNAVSGANIPNITKLFSANPFTELSASGMDVGLPKGQMGNSEVGHTNMGAGRVVYQELTRISKSIADGDFFSNPAFTAAIENCKTKDSSMHFFGLLSDGGVHSHTEHLTALLEAARRAGLKKVFIHCFMDGRDVAPSSGINYILSLQKIISEKGVGSIATVSGRYYAMDRDKRWDRLKLAYDAIALGKGPINPDPAAVVNNSYSCGVTDEFIVPTVCDAAGTVRPGDSVIFFNFRPDRARELTRAFIDPDFSGFERPDGAMPLCFVCMTCYDAEIKGVKIAFSPEPLVNTLGEYLSAKGLHQLRIAETEKYAHVTFFFNGGKEASCEGEDRALLPSPKVATYDLQPEMSANEVTAEALKRISSGLYDVIILNFANCDMVGHTGVYEAAVKAVETVDFCVGEFTDAVLAAGGAVLLTADHGNAEQMLDDDNAPFTAHTTNPVPFCIIGAREPLSLRSGGRLADIAPTMLELLGLPIPSEMTGSSLIEK